MREAGGEAVRLLWTAGFDSTYRLLELMQAGRAVRPYYVIDRARPSFPIELERMARIGEMVRARYADGRLAPVRIALRDDLRVDADLREAWEALARQAHVGTQYAWLAQFCRDMRFGDAAVELCMTRIHPPPPLQLLAFDDLAAPEPRLKPGPPHTLFRFYAWPTLHLSKAEMRARAVAQGFWPILEQSWFCHTPVGGAPCGRCEPCRMAREHRDDVALPRLGRVRIALRRARARLRRLGGDRGLPRP